MQQVQMLAYVSDLNSPPLRCVEAQRRAQAQCASLGLSGIMVLRGTIAFQVIEGAPHMVNTHLTRRLADDSAGPVTVLINEPGERRHFDTGSITSFHDTLQEHDLLATLHQIGEYLAAGLGYSPSGMVHCARRMVRGLAAVQMPPTAMRLQPA